MPPSSISRALPQLAVATASLFVGLAMLALMLWNGEVLVRLGLVGHLWYVVLLLLGLTVAACLFALFKSYARYTGKLVNGRLEIGGPAVLMLVVVVLGFTLVPAPPGRFALTVFVHGEAGRHALVLRNRGKLFLDLGADRRAEAIGDKGEVRFVGIPTDQRGRSVPLSLDAEEYELVQKDAQLTLDTEAAYVAVRPKMLHLRGEVFDARRRPLAGARLLIGNRSGATDADGHFDLPLPADLPDNERIMTITSPGHAPWRGQVTPGGNPLTVHLSPAL
jgi:hypothetical protein